MITVSFLPNGQQVQVQEKTKILAAALQNKIPIRYGCAAARCGTCAVRVILEQSSQLSLMDPDERNLLSRMQLPLDGHVRLACRCRVLQGPVEVDLEFQDLYDPGSSSQNWLNP